MTEKHEVSLMIRDTASVIDQVEYEAGTRPGEGPEFVKVLNGAIKYLGKAKRELKIAEKMLSINGGQENG